MNDLYIHRYIDKFEEMVREKRLNIDLRVNTLSCEEKVIQPLRGVFKSYKSEETNFLFQIFVAGALVEAERLDWLYKKRMLKTGKGLPLNENTSLENLRAAIDEEM
jgi:hypothetical protein|nr:MAG TPA: hypothetical protein [Caudoviricetes sp.]